MTLRPDWMFIHDWEPPAGWREELARQLGPPNDRLPYLWLDWLPGIEYCPVQRWALWEIRPPGNFSPLIALEQWQTDGESIHLELLKDLNNRCPREWGHWQQTPYEEGGWRWVSESLVDLTQWQIYRKTGGIPQLYWIIQGDRGGHKRQLTPTERQVLRTNSHPKADVPAPGDLPYAPFDWRCISMLLERDRIKEVAGSWADRTKNHQTAVSIVKAEQTAARVRGREALSKWLEGQVEEPADMLAHKFAMSDLPRGDGRYNADQEQVERSFIHNE